MRAREDHQILVHRHRHSYWQTELLAPETESNIPWRSPIVIGAVGRVAASRGCVEGGESKNEGASRAGATTGRGIFRCRKAGQAGFGEEEDAWSVGREMVLVVRVWGRESDGRGTSANPELNRVEL